MPILCTMATHAVFNILVAERNRKGMEIEGSTDVQDILNSGLRKGATA